MAQCNKPKVNVLIIEDNEDDLILLVRRLKKDFDLTYTHITDITQIGEHEIHGYDLILSDYNLPTCTGIEVFRRMQSEKEYMPFILVSNAQNQDQLVQKALSMGIRGFVHKSQIEKVNAALNIELEIDPHVRENVQELKQKFRGKKILLMDDEPYIHQTIRLFMDKLGIPLISAFDGDEAIKSHTDALEQQSPFTEIILDLNIPGGKGALYAVKSIREKDPTVPIYVTTGYYDDPILENFQQFGFTGVLAKPFNLMDLGKKFSEK